MNTNLLFSPSTPTVILVSELFSLSGELVKELIEVCRIIVISENISLWKKQFGENNRISFVDYSSSLPLKDIKRIHYIVYLESGLFLKNAKKNDNTSVTITDLVKSLSVKLDAKTLFVYPRRVEKLAVKKVSREIEDILSDTKIFAGVILVGDLIDIDPKTESGLFPDMLESLLDHRKILIQNEDFLLYPVRSRAAATVIKKSLFSLKVYGKSLAVIGRPIGKKILEKAIDKKHGELLISGASEIDSDNFDELIEDEKIVLDENSEIVVSEFIDKLIIKIEDFPQKVNAPMVIRKEIVTSTKSNIFKNIAIKLKKPFITDLKKTPPFQGGDELSSDMPSSFRRETPRFKREEDVIKDIKKPVIDKSVDQLLNKKRIAVSLVVLLFILSLPIVNLVFSIPIFYTAEKMYERGYFELSNSFSIFNSYSLRFSGGYSLLISKIPIVGYPYQHSYEVSNLLKQGSDLQLNKVKLTSQLIKLSEKLIRNDSSEVADIAKDISYGLETLYKNIGFFQGDVEESGNFAKGLVNKVVYNKITMREKEKLYLLSKIFSEYETILGYEKPSRYLIVFPNKAKARAVGGTIEKYSLVTFSGGGVLEYSTKSTQESDSKLAGKVDPPKALEKYFNKNSWSMEEAGWDPDFATSAQRIEWFLDKEEEIAVDGVISFDSNLAVNLVELKSKTNIKRSEWLHFFNKLLKTLSQRDLQIFLHKVSIERALEGMGWAGIITQAKCVGNCSEDLLSVIEVGEGADSGRIKREAQVSVSFEEAIIKRRLILFLENTETTNYKSYIRVLVSGEVGFSPVEIITGSEKNILTPEISGLRGFKDAGVYIDVLPKKPVLVVFSWEGTSSLNTKDNGSYNLTLIKQPGIAPYEVGVSFKVSDKLNYLNRDLYSLTDTGELLYNTTLEADRIINLAW